MRWGISRRYCHKADVSTKDFTAGKPRTTCFSQSIRVSDSLLVTPRIHFNKPDLEPAVELSIENLTDADIVTVTRIMAIAPRWKLKAYAGIMPPQQYVICSTLALFLTLAQPPSRSEDRITDFFAVYF